MTPWAEAARARRRVARRGGKRRAGKGGWRPTVSRRRSSFVVRLASALARFGDGGEREEAGRLERERGSLAGLVSSRRRGRRPPPSQTTRRQDEASSPPLLHHALPGIRLEDSANCWCYGGAFCAKRGSAGKMSPTLGHPSEGKRQVATRAERRSVTGHIPGAGRLPIGLARLATTLVLHFKRRGTYLWSDLATLNRYKALTERELSSRGVCRRPSFAAAGGDGS